MQNEKSLDGLRGLAAFIVVIHHYLLGFYPSVFNGNINSIRTSSGIDAYIAKTPLNLLYNGNACVCIFFILSGYVLSCKFFKYGNGNIIMSSATRRYFRLMIPVFFSISIAYIIMKLNWFYNIEVSKITGSDWWFSRFYNFTPSFLGMVKQGLYGVFFLHDATYNDVLWTMNYELYGSFIVFAVVAILGKMRNRAFFYAVFVLLTLNTYFLSFILGVILSDLFNSDNIVIKKLDIKCIKIFSFVIGLLFVSYPSGTDVTGTIYNYIKISKIDNPIIFNHILGSFFIMYSLLSSYKLKKFFSNKILLFLGKISFSLYLMHFWILCSLSSFLFLRFIKYFRYYEAFIFMSIISLSLTIILSYYVYKYVDYNAIKLSKKLYLK